jgi:hypothetical protein
MHLHLLLAATLLPLALAAPCPQNSTTNTTTPSTPSTPLVPAACALTNLTQPPNTLTAPSPDLTLVLIAMGRGTQNYTCASPAALPSAIGAVATLYDASCAVANPAEDLNNVAAPAAIGTHFFADATTPAFDVAALGGLTRLAKVQDVAAPQPDKDVRWLRLQAKDGGSSAVKFIYRLNTVGGLAPADCAGREVGEVVTVPYEAQYWVYE